MEVLFVKEITSLYERFPCSMLSTMLLLLNLSIVHGITNTFMDKLFSLLRNELLPKNNKLSATSYKARKKIKFLGLTYIFRHVCKNGRMLFWNIYQHVDVCPKRQISRFVDGSTTVPQKMWCYFPLIPRLTRMCRCKLMVKLL